MRVCVYVQVVQHVYQPANIERNGTYVHWRSYQTGVQCTRSNEVK